MGIKAKHIYMPLLFGVAYFLIKLQEREADTGLWLEAMLSTIVFAAFYYFFGWLLRKKFGAKSDK